MKLDTFVARVLQDIETGLRSAEQTTGKKFWITSTDGNPGVSFDIAVTAQDMTSTQAGGTAEGAVKSGVKVGFVEVVTANVGGNFDGKVEKRNENSEVSRIQFTVHVPTKTQVEIQQEHNAFLVQRRDTSIDDPYI